MKYRTIKTPPVRGHLTVDEAQKSARTVAGMNGSKKFKLETELRTLRSKANAGSSSAHSHKNSSTGTTKVRTVTAHRGHSLKTMSARKK